MDYIQVPRCFINTNQFVSIHEPYYITFDNPKLDECTTVESVSYAFPVLDEYTCGGGGESNNGENMNYTVVRYLLKDDGIRKRTSFLLLMPVDGLHVRTENGVIRGLKKYRLLDVIEKLSVMMSYNVSSIAVSRVEEEWFAKKWISIVGGHGYMTHWMWEVHIDASAPHRWTSTKFREKSFGTFIGKFWNERMDRGCALTSLCKCNECLYD